MVIYGVALLSFCMLTGVFLGDLLGRLIGVQANGGGVGIGYSLHAGQVIVADGTPAAAERLKRVLLTDPGMGVVRHVDAGYERAIEVAKERGVKIPQLSLGISS